MHTVILASITELEPDHVYRGNIYDKDLQDQYVAFRVVRKVEEEAYHKQRLEYAPHVPFTPWDHPVWFYEVLID